MSFITPEMNLIQPVVGVNSGLDWENAINANTAIIDGHNHSPGYGVQISPSGININAPLPFNDFQATNLQATVFTAQISLATLLAIYCIGNDLYYNDGAGNVIQITSGGSVNATSSGISSGTATASFVSSVLVVNAAANTPADIQAGSILLGNNVPASNFLTLSPPSAMPADFTLTLPTIPGAQSFLSIDTLGNIAAYANISGGITGSNIASATITGSNIASATITGSNIAAATIAGSQLTPSAGITGGQIANATITATNVANASLTGSTLAAHTVAGGQIATNVNLDGDAAQENGKNLVVSAANAATSMAVICGVVNGGGGGPPDSGIGFSQSISGITATITFSTPFASTPSGVVGLTGSPAPGAVPPQLATISTTQIAINNDNGAGAFNGASFIVMGPR